MKKSFYFCPWIASGAGLHFAYSELSVLNYNKFLLKFDVMETLFITEKAIAHEEFQSAYEIAEKVVDLCLIDRQRIDERLVYVRKVIHACEVISAVHCMLDFGVDTCYSAQEYNDAVALVREFNPVTKTL